MWMIHCRNDSQQGEKWGWGPLIILLLLLDWKQRGWQVRGKQLQGEGQMQVSMYSEYYCSACFAAATDECNTLQNWMVNWPVCANIYDRGFVWYENCQWLTNQPEWAKAFGPKHGVERSNVSAHPAKGRLSFASLGLNLHHKSKQIHNVLSLCIYSCTNLKMSLKQV